MMIERIEKLLFIGCAIALCVGVLTHNCRKNVPQETIIKTDTIYQEHIDTITLEHTVTISKPSPVRVDTVHIHDTLTNEVVQHIKKTYESDGSHEDTTCIPPARVDYHIMVRTDNNDVDTVGLSFKVDYPRITEYKTIVKETTRYKTKHWGYGVHTGVGYGLFNRKPDLYVGVGLHYNF